MMRAQTLINGSEAMQIKMQSTCTTALFRPGDVLTLRSGGQSMTATWVGPVVFAPGTWLICQWFDGDGELRQEMFAETTLAIALDALAS